MERIECFSFFIFKRVLYHLSYENKYHKEERSNKCCYAAVLKAFLVKNISLITPQILCWASHLWVITLFTQSVLHNSVPIVSCCYPKESEVGHSKWSEVCVLSQAMAWVVFITFLGLLLSSWNLYINAFHTKSSKEFNTKCGKDEEEQEEQKTEVSHLRQGLHHRVQ